MLALTILIKNIIDFYIMILLLIVWINLTNYNYHNIITQFLMKISNPLLNLFYQIFPKNLSSETILPYLILILTILKYLILLSSQINIFYFNPINLLFCFISLLKSIGNLIFWIITIRSIRSFFSGNNGYIDQLLIQLTEPILIPIRKILPNIIGIDLSPMLIIILIYALNLIGMNIFPIFWNLL